MLYKSVAICFIFLGVAYCTPERVSSEQQHDAVDAQAQLEKRSPHYDFGLGKRAYSYVSEYKRLPVYNFGLGKRSVDEEPTEEYGNDDQQTLAELFDQYEDRPVYEEKRARPYSFGLGKRSDDEAEEKRARMYDFGLGKRMPLYNFGLGKRARAYDFGLGKRARAYDFGLGKRLSSKFNFGLGKRQRDMHRFNFGLGKRSSEDVSFEDSNDYLEG